jgi:hypothetical protein
MSSWKRYPVFSRTAPLELGPGFSPEKEPGVDSNRPSELWLCASVCTITHTLLTRPDRADPAVSKGVGYETFNKTNWLCELPTQVESAECQVLVADRFQRLPGIPLCCLPRTRVTRHSVKISALPSAPWNCPESCQPSERVVVHPRRSRERSLFLRRRGCPGVSIRGYS